MITVHHIRDPFKDQRETFSEVAQKQLVATLAPEWFDWGNASHICVRDGGVHKDAEAKVTDGSCYTFQLRPRFVSGGAVLGALASSGGIITGGILALGALKLLGKLLPPSRKPAQDSEESATYGFRGLQGVRKGEGSAAQVVYGEHRVEPTLIGRFIRTLPEPASTTLYLLYHISEGPLSKIGGRTTDGDSLTLEAGTFPTGIQINNQPAENYDGLEAWVRMGGLNQTAIPGFEDERHTFTVGQTLLEPAEIASFNDVSVPGVYTTGSGSITNWDDYGSVVSYTSGTDAEQFTYIVTFPAGLFEIDQGSGSYLPRSVEFQCRYIEVDGGGTPTGDYVVLPKEPPVTNDKSGPFSVAFTHDFLDPGSSLTFGDQNEYLTLGSGAWYNKSTSAGLTAQNPEDTEFTVLAWVRPTVSGDGNTLTFLTTDQTILDHIQTNTGFRFEVTEGSGSNPTLHFEGDSYLNADARYLEIVLGDGSTTNTYNANNATRYAFTQSLLDPESTGTGVQKFTQCVFTYKANVDDEGNGRLRIYYDATLAAEHVIPSTFRPIMDATADLSVGARNTGGSPAGNAAGGFDIQELLYYQRELSEFEILSKFNNYDPIEAQSGEGGLVAGWHFDGDGADFIGSNTLVSGSGGSFSGSTLGPVHAQPAGTIKKAKYKVEVQRITADETDSLKQSASEFDYIELTTFEEFQYPASALLALKIRATDQLNTTQPLVTAMVDQGVLCPVWDQADANIPSYTLQYSNNPAWVIADMLTNTRYGLGSHYNFRDLDVASFQDFADWCDEYVHDGRGQAGDDYSKDFIQLAYSSSQERILVAIAESDVPANWSSLKVYDPITGSPGTLFKVADLAGGGADAYDSSHDATGVVELVQITSASPNKVYSFDVSGYDNLPLSTPVTGASITAGSFYPVEKRMQFDGVFDEQDASAWDAVISVAQSARAIPVRIGARVSIFYDDVRAATAMVTMGNMEKGSFELTYGSGDSTNTVVAEFLDRDHNYERRTARYEDPDLQDPAKFETFRVENKQLRGITRRSQVERHIRRDVNAHRLLKRGASFTQFVDAITYRVGDRIRVAHDIPQWGESGRTLKDSATTTQIYLDREVALGGGSYEVTVRDSASGSIETVAVSSGAGTYSPNTPLAISALSFIPAEDDLYSLALAGEQVRDFAVVDMAMRGNLKTRVQCIEYDADVYTDDFGDLDDVTVDELPVQSASLIPGSPRMIVPESAIVSGPDGSAMPGIDVSWSYGDDVAVGGTVIWLEDPARGGGFRRVGQAGPADTRYRISGEWLQTARRYRIKLQPMSASGAARGLGRCPAVPVYLHARTGVPTGPTALTARVSGERAIYSWSGGQPDRARSVELRRGGWILGLPMGTASGSSDELRTDVWGAVADASSGAGMPPVRCRYRTGLGHYSTPADVTLTEQVPGNTVLLDRSEEDSSFTGTKTDLAVEAAPSSPELWPAEERGPKLKFTGSALTATYEFTVSGVASAVYVYSQLVVDAVQVHPDTYDKTGGSTYSDLNAHRRTFEGPVYPVDGELGNCTIQVELAHSQRASAGSDYRVYQDGLFYARAMAFRITVTRPSTDYDVRIRRVALRLSKQPSRRPDVVSAALYSR